MLIATPRWKEALILTDESGRTFTFDCGWGVTPPVVCVPSEAEWCACVPAWLHDRRNDAIVALQAAGHAVAVGVYPRIHGNGGS